MFLGGRRRQLAAEPEVPPPVLSFDLGLVSAWQARSMVDDRVLNARDLADVVLYLSSSLSDMVQGQTIVVDGGVSIHA